MHACNHWCTVCTQFVCVCVVRQHRQVVRAPILLIERSRDESVMVLRSVMSASKDAHDLLYLSKCLIDTCACKLWRCFIFFYSEMTRISVIFLLLF